MAKCKDAMQKKDWEELRRQVLAIAAKARRALEVSEAAVANAYDRTYKATLSTAVARLEKGNHFLNCSEKIASNFFFFKKLLRN